MAANPYNLQDTPNSLTEQLLALKQNNFSGRLQVQALNRDWVFYCYVGRILYATGGDHRVRRWQRILLASFPHLKLSELAIEFQPFFSPGAAQCWEYQFLNALQQQGYGDRQRLTQVIHDVVLEVAFDIWQAQEHAVELQPEAPLEPRLVLLDPLQVVEDIEQNWQAWQLAGIANCLPNQAAVIVRPEQLQQQTSAAVYRTMSDLLGQQLTLRELALRTRRDIKDIIRSLLPFARTGVIQFRDVPDLPPPIAAPKQPAAAPSPAERHRATIACVDDSQMVCETMGKILTSAGYEFVPITESLRAFATLLSRRPDFIFLDLVMPNTNGYEICSQLRRVAAFRDTPIVILTGNDGIVDRVRAKLAGASDFISKPVGSDTVLEVVERHLASRRSAAL